MAPLAAEDCWGPPGILSGAAFQKNRLSNIAAAYSTLFEDDYVARLLGRPALPLQRLAEVLNRHRHSVEAELSQLAWAHFRRRTRRATGYPRYYVFECYQAAALFLLDNAGGLAAEEAAVVLRGRFPDFKGQHEEAPPGFPEASSQIGVTTFFTELVKRPELRAMLWPDARNLPFPQRLRESEQRRELLSAMARLGGAYIDLYLLAMREAGSFELRPAPSTDTQEGGPARAFVELLNRQRTERGFHAFYELHGAAGAFDTLLAVNFSQVPTARLAELSEIFGRSLQHQAPVGRMSGGVSKRLVGQFRMPGFPLVLISTDVLQEGEDLHTFCRNVVHYGIAWTPSSMEQRTGRIDRIGSLVQRQLDGRDTPAEPEEKIQVLYPHLADTIEVLQVRRVLDRLDRFMRLMHRRDVEHAQYQSTIDKNVEMIAGLPELSPPQGPLESAFPVRQDWLRGELGQKAATPIPIETLSNHFESIWKRLVQALDVREPEVGSNQREGLLLFHGRRLAPRGIAPKAEGVRHQFFRLALRSRALGDATLIRCESPVGLVDLSDQETVAELHDLQRTLGHARVCAHRDLRHKSHHIAVEASLLFHPETSQYEEVEALVREVTLQADWIEEVLLARDAEAGQDLWEEPS